jgi:non-heme chloroperoxidase
MQSERNPDGVPNPLIDSIRDGTAFHRSQFYQDITMPFYGFSRPDAVVLEGIRQNWRRQGMMGRRFHPKSLPARRSLFARQRS